ncbi:MAG TPA: hypothetical protein VFM25_10015 [Verrucomicrobiae bacterium]|nr:hypothetical protein [Verrucomicrobiae bacterium]
MAESGDIASETGEAAGDFHMAKFEEAKRFRVFYKNSRFIDLWISSD